MAATAPASGQVVSGPAVPVSGAPSLPALRFDLARQEMRDQYRAAAAALKGALDAISSLPKAQANFANTVLAQERAYGDFHRAVTPLVFHSQVNPDKGRRLTGRAIDKVADRLSVDLGQRQDLSERATAAAEKNEALVVADRRLLEKTLREYRDNGLELEPAQRERFKAIQFKLNDLASRFRRNINEHKDWLEVDEAGLEGLPEGYQAGLEKTESGRYRIGLDYQSYVHFMPYAKNRELRRQLESKFYQRGSPANLPILRDFIKLADEMARLLGYQGYPELILRDRMAKTPQRVSDFLARIAQLVKGRAEVERARLLEIKRRDEPAATNVLTHELAYYSRILREEKYALGLVKH